MTLQEFFTEHPKAALGFSGGVDSSYLLYAGIKAGADIRPYFIKTAFQPEFELEDAKRLCAQLGAELHIIELDALANPDVVKNPANRCYYCKTGLFTWDKPAYACLATRVPTGEAITEALLARVEGAEQVLFSLGFTDFRVRVFHDAARVQLKPAQMQQALSRRSEILENMKPYFEIVLLDLNGR